METVCDLSSSSLCFFFCITYWRSVSHYTKRKKGRVLKHRNVACKKRHSNSLRPFSVLLVTTSIGRKVHCPTYSSALPDVCITTHGGKSRQASDLYKSTHSLRHIASVCVPCCVIFFSNQQEKVVFSTCSKTL